MRHAVIMAGGSGTRLWPMSRKSTPKQFQKLIGDKTLIQDTYNRLRKSFDDKNIWVVVGSDHSHLVNDQLPGLPQENIIAEPMGKNTAAATILAALTIKKRDPDALLFGLVPADHYVGKSQEFIGATNAALSFIESNPHYVVVFGILPTEPNTGLGYIKKKDELTELDGYTVSTVASFHEKPDLLTAKKFVRSGRYLWNGGYFLFSADGIIEHFQNLAPDIYTTVSGYLAKPTPENYNKVPSQQIDTAIAERLSDKNLAVIPVDLDWSDIGNWATLHEILSKSGQENATPTGLHVSDDDNNGTLVLGGSKLIVTVGLKDTVVIDTDDVILICDKNSSQDVKKIVEKLKEEGKEHLL